MMAKTKKKPAIPAADLAILNGRNAVTYTPQINQVRDLSRQADEQYTSDIEAAKANAVTAGTAARNAMPTMKSIYDTARSDTDATHQTANDAAGNLGPAADVFGAALAREQGANRDRLTSARATALSDLQNSVVGAESGRQFAIIQAKKERAKTRGVLSQKLADILQEQGATSAATLATLSNDRDTAAGKVAAQTAKDDAANQKRQDKLDAAKQKHLDTVHTATGDYRNKIADAASQWADFAKSSVTDKNGNPVPIRDPVIENGKAKLDKNGNVVTKVRLNPKTGLPVYDTSTPSPTQLKQMLADVRDQDGHIKYTPGDIHIMLLRRANKPMDAAAMAYLKQLAARGVRIPRAWLPNPGSGGNAPSRTGMGDFQ